MKNAVISVLLFLFFMVTASAQLVRTGDGFENKCTKITLATSGLPAQVFNKPVDRDVKPADLFSIGRGDLLRQPIALMAKQGNRFVSIEPKAPAVVEKTGNDFKVTSKLSGGAVNVDLTLVYHANGVLTGRIDYQGASMEGLCLDIPLLGSVNTVVCGDPAKLNPGSINAKNFVLKHKPGTVWANAGPDKPKDSDLTAAPVMFMFVGSGDRGITFLADSKGWLLDPSKPSAEIIIDKETKQYNWRISIVNKPSNSVRQSLEFAVLFHPLTARPASARRDTWLGKGSQPVTNGVNTLAAASSGKRVGVIRADCASVNEANAPSAVMCGPAGGDAISKEKNIANTYPMPLFRFLAATHTGLPVVLRTNSGKIGHAGGCNGGDRLALGRALLHDIGADCRTMANKKGALTVIKALNDFGFFDENSQIEFIPYWRARDAIAYGQTFRSEDAFEMNAEDPLARAYVSAYKKDDRFLVIVVNESDKPLREQLIIRNSKKVLGGVNRLRLDQVVAENDFRNIPENSDWSKERMTKLTRSRQSKVSPYCLKDLEDCGALVCAERNSDVDVYGPLYVPANGIRVLAGYFKPAKLDKAKRKRK